MHKSFFSILLCLLCSPSLFAQQGIIRGIVVDSLSARPVPYAGIRLCNASDSSFVKGATSNDKGAFSIAASPGNYLLDISLLGYKSAKRSINTTKAEPDSHLGSIVLYQEGFALGEMVVTAQLPDVLVKGDTIEYNAAAYLPDESAILQDLVKNLPGVELDGDGNLKANGKRITKITVDGKEFFNNDMQMALKNLPANMVKKLQLFQEQSEKSKVSGIKDNNENQALNLEVKEEFRQSVFGDAALGYGSKDRYLGRAMVNVMKNDNMLSVLTGTNNTNEEIDGNDYQLIGYGVGGGIDTKKEAAINFNARQSDELTINGDVWYGVNSNLTEDESKTESIDVENGNSIHRDTIRTSRDQRDLNVYLNFDWKPDSLTVIYFGVTGGYSETQSTEKSGASSYYIDKEQNRTRSSYLRNTKGDGYKLRGTLNAGRKLNSKGRNISFGFSGSLRENRSKGFNKSLTEYSSGVENKTQDQRLKTGSDESAYTLSVSYLEPVTDKNSLNISYSLHQDKSGYTNDKYKKADPSNPLSDYTVIDTLYASSTNDRRLSQKVNLGFQSLHEKLEYNIELGLDFFSTKNTITRRIDSVECLRQNAVNFSPKLWFKYLINNHEQLNISYRGSTRHPSADQLSADTTYLNNTSKIYGNPNLKAGFENSFGLYYQKSDYEKGGFMYIGGSFNQVLNQVASYSKKDTLFNSASSYKNVSGNWGADLSLTCNAPIKKDKWTFSTYTSFFFHRNKGFANGEENSSSSAGMHESITLNFKSKKLESRLRSRYSYNLTKNSLQSQRNVDISNLFLSNTTRLKLPFDFKLENNLSYSHNFGYGSDYKKSEIMWNAGLSKQFLRKKMGTLKIQFYDILNDRNNTNRYAGNGYISDMRTNTIGRYVMFSFSYRFNLAKGEGVF
ncbi:TonB-dependent receptor [Viscerimonas tarda]